MSWQMAALLLLGGSTVLLFIGMPVAFSFIAINLIGAVLFLGGEAGLAQLVRNSSAAVMNFSLTPIPLFILWVKCSSIPALRSKSSTESSG